MFLTAAKLGIRKRSGSRVKQSAAISIYDTYIPYPKSPASVSNPYPQNTSLSICTTFTRLPKPNPQRTHAKHPSFNRRETQHSTARFFPTETGS